MSKSPLWFAALAVSITLSGPVRSAHADECHGELDCDVKFESLRYDGAWDWKLRADASTDGRLSEGDNRGYESSATAGAELAYRGSTCT